jgi:predicted nucleotidyltransferase component of viral defense system
MTDQEQATHQKWMLSIAKAISHATKGKYILKGGTALMFFYGIDRFSVDLDYDVKERMDIKNIIVSTANATCGKNAELNVKKDTDTAQRYIIHFVYKNSDKNIKIDCSSRDKAEINFDMYSLRDGIHVYNIEEIIKQKCNALMGRERPRDIYDVSYLLRTYPHQFEKNLLITLDKYLDERGMDNIVSNFETTVQTTNDFTLIDKDSSFVVLSLYENLHTLIENISDNANFFDVSP